MPVQNFLTDKIYRSAIIGQKESGDALYSEPVELKAKVMRNSMDSRGVQGNQQRTIHNQRTTLVTFYCLQKMNLRDRVWVDYEYSEEGDPILTDNGFEVQACEYVKSPLVNILYYKIQLS
jgi:hypothetical protein